MPNTSAVERPVVAEPISELNLSVAWLRAFQSVTRRGVEALAPLVVTVLGFDDHGAPEQVPEVEALIDEALLEQHESKLTRRPQRAMLPLSCHTAANTIFPESLWNPDRPRQELYSRYHAVRKTLRKDPRNRRGIYFERLIDYAGAPEEGNQLEHLIRLHDRGVKRISAYQASISRPGEDLTGMPLQGFPCLQQVALHPNRGDGSLALTAFYGTQYIFERAYGNYLGLCRLGAFLAHEMGLRLTRMTCIAGHAPRGGLTMTRARRLVDDSANAIQSAGVPL